MASVALKGANSGKLAEKDNMSIQYLSKAPKKQYSVGRR
jgi:hypothetical protein